EIPADVLAMLQIALVHVGRRAPLQARERVPGRRLTGAELLAVPAGMIHPPAVHQRHRERVALDGLPFRLPHRIPAALLGAPFPRDQPRRSLDVAADVSHEQVRDAIRLIDLPGLLVCEVVAALPLVARIAAGADEAADRVLLLALAPS